jgi:hypothetical protein
MESNIPPYLPDNALSDLGNIRFTPRATYARMPVSDYVAAWESGKGQMLNLFTTMIEELELLGKREGLSTSIQAIAGASFRSSRER